MRGSAVQYQKTYSELTGQGLRSTWFLGLSLCKVGVARLLGLLLHVPLLKPLIIGHFGGLSLLLQWLEVKQDWGLFSAVLVEALSRCYKKQSGVWWNLMRRAVALLQYRQISVFSRNIWEENRLIGLGMQGPQPAIGYDAAYSLVGFSLWLFERGELHTSLELVGWAALADPTWGFPEYLIGWYGLFTGDVDSARHFANAVRLDWGFLHRIRRDKMCRRFPKIIEAVRRGVVIQGGRSERVHG